MKAEMPAPTMRSLILCVVATLILSSPIPAAALAAVTEWHVATDGDDTWPGTQSMPFQTIARGLEAAATGDTVLIHDGTYTGPGNRDLRCGQRWLTIRSASGDPESCIIDAEFDSTGTGWIFLADYGPDGSWSYPPVLLEGLTFRNGASGGVSSSFSIYGGGDIDNCRFENCDVGYSGGNGDSTVRNSQFRGCGTGAWLYTDYFSHFEDCVFVDNGYGVYGWRPWAFFLRCEFYGHEIAAVEAETSFSVLGFTSTVIRDNPGNGIVSQDGSSIGITDTAITYNGGIGVSATMSGWGFPQIRMSNSTIAFNSGRGVEITPSLTAYDPYQITVDNCTLANNGGGGFAVTQPSTDLTVEVINTIVAFNIGEALADHGATYTNCVVYGNGADDLPDSWQPGIAGNFAKDPLFCDAASGDYGLAANSPCAPSALHDLIGAHGVACAGIPGPVLLSVADVPQDQGGQVRLTWYRSGHDEAGSAYPILGYDVYRRLDAKAVAVGRDPAGKLLGWDYLLRVPARGDQGYQVIAPTLCDSTIPDGLCESVFLVSAVTADPLTFFDSSPDSGWSTDDLAPGAPTAVTAAYQQAGVALDWADSPEPDFQLFRIYRATDPDFVPTPEALVHQTSESTWSDPQTTPWANHYKITAVDAAGNESGPGSPAGISGVEGGTVPTRTALVGAVPNPFNPTTTVAFDLAAPGRVVLRIYDVSGRLTATLLDEQRAAGRHEVAWHGRDECGRAMASGVYLYRLESGGYTETRRMALVR